MERGNKLYGIVQHYAPEWLAKEIKECQDARPHYTMQEVFKADGRLLAFSSKLEDALLESKLFNEQECGPRKKLTYRERKGGLKRQNV